MPDPLSTRQDVLPALELVLDYARGYLTDLDGPVRTPTADEAARAFPADFPDEGEGTLAAVQRYVDDILLLEDSTILGGLRFAAERLKQVVEPAGAAALAAVIYGKVPLRDGDRVCVLLSGGNVDLDRLGQFLAQAAALPTAMPIPA